MSSKIGVANVQILSSLRFIKNYGIADFAPVKSSDRIHPVKL
jgi:hypothetical protein